MFDKSPPRKYLYAELTIYLFSIPAKWKKCNDKKKHVMGIRESVKFLIENVKKAEKAWDRVKKALDFCLISANLNIPFNFTFLSLFTYDPLQHNFASLHKRKKNSI